MNRPDVIDYLKQLTDKQFVELFYEATVQRRIDPTSTDYEQSRWVLAEASRYLADDGKSWEPWDVSLLALHDPKEYPDGWDDDAPICQQLFTDSR